METLRILMLEDDAADAELVAHALRRAGVEHTALRVGTQPAFLEALDGFRPDIILADHNLPEFTALDAVRLLHQQGVNLPVILVTGTQSDEVAAEYLKEGVDDYLLKTNLARLPAAVTNALRRHRAEHERAEMESRYRIVSEVASDFAYSHRVGTDGTMVCEWVTESVTRLTGYTPEDLAGRDAEAVLVHPDERPVVAEMRARVLAGAGVSADLRIVTQSGEARWVAVNTRPVWDAARQRVVRVYGAARDITERRRVEDALRESETRYRVVTETATDAIFTIDHESRILFANPAAEEIFGYSHDELIGQPITLLMPEALRSRHLTAFRRYLEAGERHFDWRGVELTGQRKDGSQFPVEISLGETVKDGRQQFTGIARDITERKRAEEAQARLAAAIESAEDAILTKTVDGVVTSWNPAAERVYGYRADEIVGRPASALIPPDRMEEEARILERIRLGERVERSETVRVRKDGTRIVVSVSVSPIRDAQGRVIGASAIARDITPQKRAEEERHRTTELLGAIVESSPSAIVAYDRDTRVTVWNPAASRMFGWTYEEVIGKLPEHVPESELERFGTQWKQALRGETLRGTEGLRRTRNGSVIEVGISSCALRDSTGNLIGIVNVIADITERKRALRELAERERGLAEAEGIARLGSWAWDMRSGKMRWSDELYRLLGFRPQECEHTVDGFLAMVHGEDRRRVTEIMLRSFRRPAPFEFYARIQRRDGAVRIHHAMGQVVTDPDGNPVEMRGTAQDVTEQEQARAELEASREDLRQLARRLEEIREEERARISREIHDQLGQALTGLKLDLAWIKGKLRKDQETLRERNDAMVELADSTIDTVRRIAAELRPGLLDDLGLPAAVEWQVHEFAKRTGIDTRLDIGVPDREVPPDVATALFRILQEALTNVVRHSAAKQVKVRLVREDQQLVLSVADNGRGPGDNVSGPRQSLGILGMQERARALGGDVEVTGKAGLGTTVVTRIPVPAAP